MNTIYNKTSADFNQADKQDSIVNVDKDDFKMAREQETKDVSDELDQEIAKLKQQDQVNYPHSRYYLC